MARYADFFRHSNDAFLLIDDARCVVDANPRAMELYGIRQEDLGALSADALIVAGMEDAFARVPDDAERGAVFEARHRRSDGAVLDVEISAKRVDIEGQRFLACSVRDASARKREVDRLGFLNRSLSLLGAVGEAIAHLRDRQAI